MTAPPPLDYASPVRTTTIRRPWTASWSRRGLLIASTLATAVLALGAILSASPDRSAFAYVALPFCVSLAFWPMVVGLAIVGPWRPSTVLRGGDLAYTLLLVGASAAVLTSGSRHGIDILAFTSLTLLGGIGLIVDAFEARRLRPFASIACLTIGFATMLPVATCPHATQVRLPGFDVLIDGKPCNNPQRFGPWWVVLRDR